MRTIIEYRTDIAPVNAYPRRIVSPPTPSACCHIQMVPLGPGGIDGRWRFAYKRCPTCGYTVRWVYAPSLLALFATGRELRIALAEMNLGAAGRKRRTRAQLEADRALARRGLVRQGPGKPLSSAA